MSKLRRLINSYLPIVQNEDRLLYSEIQLIIKDPKKSDQDILLAINNSSAKNYITQVPKTWFEKSISTLIKDAQEIVRLDNSTQNSSSPLHLLPPDLHRHIFSFFTRRQAARVRGTSRLFNKLYRDPQIKFTTLPVDYSKPEAIKKDRYPTEIYSLCSLSDTEIATGDMRGTIRIWNISLPKGSECVLTLQAHTSWINSLVRLADGRIASTGREENVIKIWDLTKKQGHECVAILRGHTTAVNTMATLGNKLASGSDNGEIKVWNLANPAETALERELTRYGSVYNLIFLDPTHLASCGQGENIQLFDLSKPVGEEWQFNLSVPRERNGYISSLAALPNNRLASAEGNGTQLTVWDLTKKSIITSLADSYGRTRALAVQNGFLISLNSYQEVIVRDTDNFHSVQKLKADMFSSHPDLKKILHLLPDGSLVVGVGQGFSTHLFKPKEISESVTLSRS